MILIFCIILVIFYLFNIYVYIYNNSICFNGNIELEINTLKYVNYIEIKF